MRRTLLAAVCCVALTGCGSLPNGGGDVVAQAQAIARATCAFVPTAATVAEIIAVGNPAVQTASAVAAAICAAVNRPAAARHGGKLTVEGVEVRGRRVRG